MTKTKTLIIIGVVLTIVIIGLIVYAYQTTQLTSAPTNTTSQNKLKESSTEEQSSSATDIKEKMKSVEQKALEEMESEDETAQEYQEEAETSKVATAQGIVLAINPNSLTVKFSQGSMEWQADVKINQDTFIAIPASAANPQPKKISLTDLKQNDNLVVNIAEDATIINNQDFTAGSIFRLE